MGHACMDNCMRLSNIGRSGEDERTHLFQHVLAALVAAGQARVGLRIVHSKHKLPLHICKKRVAVLVSAGLVLVQLPDEGRRIAVIAEGRGGVCEVLLLELLRIRQRADEHHALALGKMGEAGHLAIGLAVLGDTNCKIVAVMHLELLAGQQPCGLVQHILRERLEARLGSDPHEGPVLGLNGTAGIHAYKCGGRHDLTLVSRRAREVVPSWQVPGALAPKSVNARGVPRCDWCHVMSK
eukprot:5745752-Pyramimonas_sp.AAC.2